MGNVIRYRTVFNDACALPWEDMPEVQPPTLQGLIDYLKKCPGWDYTQLSTEYQGRDPHEISYGPRKLFWLPTVPDAYELFWLKRE